MKRKQARAILQTAARMAAEEPTQDLYVQRGGGVARLESIMDAHTTDGERYIVAVTVTMRRVKR